jgi:hypothetical protein
MKIRDASGTLRAITGVAVRDAGGVLRQIKTIKARDAAGVLRVVFNGFKVSASPSSTTGYCYSPGFTTAITGIVTANVTGGTAPFTYAWTADSGWSALSPTNYATSFRSPGLSPGDEANGSAYVTVTDANGATAVSNTVDLYATNTHF